MRNVEAVEKPQRQDFQFGTQKNDLTRSSTSGDRHPGRGKWTLENPGMFVSPGFSTASSGGMTKRVAISALSRSDSAEFIAAAAASQRLHASWVSPPTTSAAFQERLRRLRPPKDFAFSIRRRDTGELVGYVDVTNIVRGLFLSAYVSYYAFQGHERQGLMTEGLSLVVRYAFDELGLHRIEANIQPGNAASIGLVKACGFSKEGYSPKYLKIRGRWRDHERWAKLAR
jgi:[ribosomal protein S5]-alanine N-acetyltransferase